MRKISVKHVERNRARNSVCARRENEFWLAINKSCDQPSRPDAVDLRARTRQPCFPLILLYVKFFELLAAASVLPRAEAASPHRVRVGCRRNRLREFPETAA